MQVFYSDMVISKEEKESKTLKIFLAGPTPRSDNVKSWRIEALEILSKFSLSESFHVYVPERRDWKTQFDYVDQVEWELEAMKNATYVIFWVPRNMENMPALTTNVEFGMNLGSKPNSVFYGRPEGAPQTRYLDYLYTKITKRKPCNTLEETLRARSS